MNDYDDLPFMLCYVVCEKNKRKIMQNQNIIRFWFQFNNEAAKMFTK